MSIELSLRAKGTFLELEFASECIKRGAEVSFPVGGHARYDVLVDNGERIYKVQVKTSSYNQNRGSYNVNMSAPNNGRKGGRHVYTKKEVDCIATRIEGIWFFIDRLGDVTCTSLNPNPKIKSKNAGKYMDRWDLVGLGNNPQGELYGEM